MTSEQCSTWLVVGKTGNSLQIQDSNNAAFFEKWNIRGWEEKEKRIGKLKINGIVCQSVIYLSDVLLDSELNLFDIMVNLCSKLH